MKRKKIPNFLIIGAAKSGTSSLYGLLRQHPQVFMSKKKEINFFGSDNNFQKGWDWYESFFAGSESALAIGEATPAYTSRTENPKVVKRIADSLPGIKMIYIVRHPIRRIESFWRFRFIKAPDLSINQMVREESLKPWHIDRSRYWFQLSAYREYFRDDQILVLFFEDFKADPVRTLRQCFEFIGVDPTIEISSPNKIYNKTSSSIVEVKSIFHKFRRLPFYNFIRDIFPETWRKTMMMKTRLKKEIKVPMPEWDPDTLRWVVDQLAEEARKFLEFYGKPADFWVL
jgi:hypothetical protein